MLCFVPLCSVRRWGNRLEYEQLSFRFYFSRGELIIYEGMLIYKFARMSLNYLVQDYFRRKMLAYSQNFMQLVQTQADANPVIIASGLPMASLWKAGPFRISPKLVRNEPLDMTMDFLPCDSFLGVDYDEKFVFEIRFNLKVVLGLHSVGPAGGVLRVVVHTCTAVGKDVRFVPRPSYVGPTSNGKERKSFVMNDEQKAQRVAAAINAVVSIWEDEGDSDSLHKEVIRKHWGGSWVVLVAFMVGSCPGSTGPAFVPAQTACCWCWTREFCMIGSRRFRCPIVLTSNHPEIKTS